MKKLYLLAALALLAFSTSGCSVNPATGQQSFTGLMSSDEEIQVGRQEHPKILRQYGGAYDHEAISKYVDDLGQRLAKVSELPNLKWTFTVLDDPIINAFALPGGYIYISRGLIGLAENEAELAAVLGHEIGHVTARHTAQRYSQSVLTGVGATILGIVVGGPAGDLANFAGQAYIASYSRGHEMEADMLGMRYMTRLGYDPKASASFFKKLAEHTELEARMKGKKGEQSHYSIFSTHPDTRIRIQESEKIAKTYPADLDLINRRTFLALIDGLDYGESVKQGIIDGQTFIHRDLRMEFTVPQGFTYHNSPTLLIATHNNGSAIKFDLGDKSYGRLPMTRYLTEVWGKKLNLVEVERLNINGMEAATGRTQIRTKSGSKHLRYLAIDGKDRIFQLTFLTPIGLTNQMNEDLRRTTYSFRRLSHREAAQLRGFHIGLHKVGHHDSIASLAQRMKVEKFHTDWLKVLNKETLSNGLQNGEIIKLVTR
ncbi:M48 family metalloprotease [Terasakiella sp. SH-1]|uniref:M48 family metalloprotease n=1 Tax=Terasakiella sp. SH-1 TaxID=2560057 RepID=UPI0010735C68|nr:M48 family metalloprotease [Terasakiella sp. SH-1]